MRSFLLPLTTNFLLTTTTSEQQPPALNLNQVIQYTSSWLIFSLTFSHCHHNSSSLPSSFFLHLSTVSRHPALQPATTSLAIVHRESPSRILPTPKSDYRLSAFRFLGIRFLVDSLAFRSALVSSILVFLSCCWTRHLPFPVAPEHSTFPETPQHPTSRTGNAGCAGKALLRDPVFVIAPSHPFFFSRSSPILHLPLLPTPSCEKHSHNPDQRDSPRVISTSLPVDFKALLTRQRHRGSSSVIENTALVLITLINISS